MTTRVIEPWTRVASEPAGDFKIFKLRKDVMRSPRNGQTHPFVVMEGVDWVNVIPITPEGNVVFVEQWRHGIRATTLEIPGGMVDAGEDPGTGAARELREETGYAGAPVELLGRIHPNPAIQENLCHSYVMRDARRVAEAAPEGSEDIVTREIPLAQVPRLIAEGQITHALVVVAFQWLWLKQGMPPRGV